jgi:hypothetical protein
MQYMLVRNRVQDYAVWKRVFDQQAEAARAAGLRLVHLWRAVDDPDDVYFLLGVDNMEAAEAYVNAPESADVGQRAGVIDGDIRYLDAAR